MIVIVDYGMGNLHSVANAFTTIGEQALITRSPEDLRRAARIVLPGVGAFGEGMNNLRATGLVPVLDEEVRGKGKPMLGICLGMQMLGSEGREDGRHAGLGWIAGAAEPLAPSDASLKLPHVGWDDIAYDPVCPLFDGLRPRCDFYFTHSYHLVPADPALRVAACDYGGIFAAAVLSGSVFAVQFHPEKSQSAGLRLLENFASWQPDPDA